jgi:hydrogenase large subunit
MATTTLNLDVSLNRVEGDLEIGVTLEDGVVTEARCKGTLYRGFEQLLQGRAPRDAMVITPRVCGICSTAHLYAGVLALEDAWQVSVPANATRIRNLCLMAEGVQNDIRQTFLFFTPDLTHARFAGVAGHADIVAAFEPFKGSIYREALAQSRRMVEVVAHFGGQWPHSSYMLPGGVTTPANPRRLMACRAALDEVTRWYEQRVVGATLDDWLGLSDADTLLGWMDGAGHAHADSALGRMGRFTRALGLHRGHGGATDLLSYGAWCDPEAWTPGGQAHLLPGGVFDASSGAVAPLDAQAINEHVRHSWFRPYDGGRHPWQGETVPDYQPDSDRYTWAKAPRYGERVMQTGPIAELLIGGDALMRDLYERLGGSAWLRQFARVRRAGVQLRLARQMLDELAHHLDAPHFCSPSAQQERDGQGQGMVMAARGALGHWVTVRDGVVERYQIITPTGWNASPRDSAGVPGHWEQSVVGVHVADPEDPIELGLQIRSHDPCLVCTVHVLDTGHRFNV